MTFGRGPEEPSTSRSICICTQALIFKIGSVFAEFFLFTPFQNPGYAADACRNDTATLMLRLHGTRHPLSS